MIQIEDLQPGDWLTDSPNGFPMQVQAIYQSLDPQSSTVYLDFEENEGDTWEVDLPDACPIELDAHWLRSAGFECAAQLDKQLKYRLKRADGGQVMISTGLRAEAVNCFLTSRSGATISIPCHQVHVLQNAYRLLFHEPLHFNPFLEPEQTDNETGKQTEGAGKQNNH